ncbi:hypothetical protein, conserved in T. vivax [Trypanosoma vivax Y486]|uniref:Uncharacterized protein n=1 Tax=Trypanosoma vivax (strain Y486) TaxID=1055687 RepID=F9WR40_TRYVY|nr:hypothetical protein, conserved in T. vivax [Trypanosoma vivax Y486]|eukprot:CCD20023.1 hypothetical protein, conserved in T. vivax [Trypanosoma vivax Y486]
MAKKPSKEAAMERRVRKRKTQTEVQRIMPGEADRRRGGDSMAQRAKQCAGEYTRMKGRRHGTEPTQGHRQVERHEATVCGRAKEAQLKDAGQRSKESQPKRV